MSSSPWKKKVNFGGIRADRIAVSFWFLVFGF